MANDPNWKSWKDQSRINWGSSDGQTRECLQLGAVLRIADATETMARNHDELIRQRDNYKQWYDNRESELTRLQTRIYRLRGVITRLIKNKGKYHTSRNS